MHDGAGHGRIGAIVDGVFSSESRHPLGGLLRLAVLAALIAMAWRAGDVVLGELGAAGSPGVLLHTTLAAAILAYVVLMMLPFCPGIEIGLALLVVGGPGMAPLVYLATVAALMLAFLIGRFVPPRIVIEALGLLGLSRARELLLRIEPLGPEQRLCFLLGQERPRLLRWLLEHRYVAVAIALNAPGNIVIGDGGGIALAAGFSRLFSVRGFALTVMLAVSPVPIAVMLLA
jgi:hypothetical protein